MRGSARMARAKADELPLAEREVLAALVQHGVVAVRQALDEVVRADGLGGLVDLVVASPRAGRSGCSRATVPEKRNGSCSTTPMLARQRAGARRRGCRGRR